MVEVLDGNRQGFFSHRRRGSLNRIDHPTHVGDRILKRLGIMGARIENLPLIMGRRISHSTDRHEIRTRGRIAGRREKLRDGDMGRIVHDQFQSGPVGEYERPAATDSVR